MFDVHDWLCHAVVIADCDNHNSLSIIANKDGIMADAAEAVDQAQRHLTAQELADRLGVPLNTAYYWRSIRKGPRAMRIGKYVRYRLEDVLAWEQAQLDERESA